MSCTTNYRNTFISVAEDCPATAGETPPARAVPTVARLQFDLLRADPYGRTSDEVLFAIHVLRGEIPDDRLEEARAIFFQTARPCLRTSPLARRYGWGIHHDADARVALYPRESREYLRLSQDPAIAQVLAMRSARKG